MKFVRRLWDLVKPVSRAQWIFTMVVLVVLSVVLIGTPYAWDYSNSSPFCGTQCHTMPTHYESYLRSPHARVQCTECHIGRTFVGIAFTRKAVDAQFVWAYWTGNYEYPIFARGLQPARESCEKCHWPEKFSWDKVVTLAEYQPDEKNTEVATTLLMKIGGGTARTGLGRGIHWHVENIIEFKYSDKLQQQIPWVAVTNNDGTKTIYTDIESTLTASQLAALPTRQMDCIDCHNRVSHTFESPTQAIDAALQTKQVDPTIPAIKKKAIEVLTPHYKTDAEAKQAIGALEQFYQQNYAAFYGRNSAAVQKAVKYLQELYPRIFYREQELDWKTHPDNLGHQDWPGCFRCHDGKHFTSDRKEAVRLECNICHAIPEVTTAGGGAAALSLTRTDEPPSHKTTTWLAEHRLQFNTSCQACHDTNNAGGKDNTSFCSNSACHGVEWKFAGLNAPKLAEIVKSPLRPVTAPGSSPKPVPHPVGGNPDCQICHGATALAYPYPADHTNRPNSTCLGCHKPSVAATAATPIPGAKAGGPPRVTHSTAGRAQCLGCHGSGSTTIPQITQFHKDFGFTNPNCMTCHKTAGPGESAPAPGATPPAQSGGGIKPQPANHAGRTICLACHNAGVGPKPPADHAGRADATCAACHPVAK